MAVSALLYHRKCGEKWVGVEISKPGIWEQKKYLVYSDRLE